ncbi:unnamed protein product [Ceutorhynchus assimilis]|uniref:Uncharacterized protein n=1 Tax=Ceutorhynchus assimilis TaxID=467358 RepID=A0A9N9MPR8_9CUCU|nr:unnamed protein product [Ceutorhynchus assimilis]
MLSKITLLSALVAVALSAAVQEPVPIVSQTSDVHPDGNFEWGYESADGSSQQQSGHLVGTGDAVGEAVQGSASWVDNEGNQHQLTYTADENGYQPQSADLPVAPEIPAAILKSLEWNMAHPEPEQH